jgi:hypothetical protein
LHECANVSVVAWTRSHDTKDSHMKESYVFAVSGETEYNGLEMVHVVADDERDAATFARDKLEYVLINSVTKGNRAWVL